jgi:hypothetical protein
MWWKGRDENCEEFYDTILDALIPAVAYHFAHHHLDDHSIFSSLYSLFD